MTGNQGNHRFIGPAPSKLKFMLTHRGGVEKRHGTKQKRPHWHVAMRPGKRRVLPDTPLARVLEKIEYYKASVRAKVEHPFHIIKNLLGLMEVRYRGLAKNTARLYALFGLAKRNRPTNTP